MTEIKWFWRIMRDAVLMGYVNRSPVQSLAIVLFLLLGLVMVAAHVSAPFIYTLF